MESALVISGSEVLKYGPEHKVKDHADLDRMAADAPVYGAPTAAGASTSQLATIRSKSTYGM